MLLTIDIGNTLISIAVYEKEEILYTFETKSDVDKSLDEYVALFTSFCEFKKIGNKQIKSAIIASVVPLLTKVIEKAIKTVCKTDTLILGPGIKTGLPVLIDHPLELGSDLVAVSVGGISKYGKPLIIVDLGTAIKVIAINKQGAFVGTAFHPGLYVGVDALISRAAQLLSISLTPPKKVIGKNTLDATNSGALYGASEMIKGLVKLFEKELGYETKHLLTGGDALYVKDLLPSFTYDAKLVHIGLKEIFEKNERAKNDDK
ncbi:MAG: type III pantothenate kinase [Bacilli bacterium]